MMKFWRSLVTINSKESSKSFTLLITAMVTCLIGLCVCFVLCWDVVTNGYLKTDLESLGVFMICMGGYLAGGSVSKIAGERVKKGTVGAFFKEHLSEEGENYEVEEETTKKKKK